MTEPLGIRETLLEPGVWQWTLSNPARRNAVGPGALRFMAQRCSQLRGDVVVLTGEGEEAFCAGFDLRALTVPDERAAADAPLPDAPLIAATTAMRQADATFVAVMRGYAIGAGVELACACDVRLVAPEVTFAIPAARLGVVYHSAGLVVLRSVFGPAFTRRLMLFGDRFDAVTLARGGADLQIVERADLDRARTDLVDKLRAAVPISLRGNRAFLRALDAGRVDADVLAAHQRARVEAYAMARHTRGASIDTRQASDSATRYARDAMSIRDDIEARLKQARRDRDEPTRNVIGMLKNKVLTELKSGSGRAEDDALWRDVISGYAKQLQKSIPEFEKAGERGVEGLQEAKFELGFCELFLPKKFDEAQTEALLRKLASEHGMSDPKMAGKLMGLAMKDHRDELDPTLTKTLATRVLGG